MKRGRILIVDDEANARNALAELLIEENFQVDTAADGFKALPKLDEFSPDVVLTDLRMPGLSGLDLIQKIKAYDPHCPVMVMTAYGAVETAVSAMKSGAYDYVTKPVHVSEIVVMLDRAIENRKLQLEATALRNQVREKNPLFRMGTSPLMKKFYDLILQIAPSKATVLIQGETGTGKERVAEWIHQHSPRAEKPLIKVHCAALPETLLESELFGHERGAFTGAIARREGRFEQANGGSLFLDEIAEIPLSVQVKLLRVLQEKSFERVGGKDTLHVDVRLITATHRNLTTMVKEGLFREDLYYRLNVVTLEVPPLRLRGEDIMLLAHYFLNKFNKENDKSVSGFSSEALAHILQYPWPGNVRELENAIERAVVINRSQEVSLEDLPAQLSRTLNKPDGYPIIPGSSLAELEKYAILKTLEFTGGSTSKTSEILQISPRTIQYRLKEYQDNEQGRKSDAPKA